MSKLDDLINKHCPNGVEYKKIELFTNYEQPGKYIVDDTDYSDDFETPVLTAGQTFILGYTNEKNGIFKASKESPVIIFDDFTGAFKWVDFPFKVKSSAMKIITTTNNVQLRFLFHFMGNLNFTSNEHKRLWIATYSQFEIPVPPLEVQNEIVRILDTFTSLTAELTAELTARRKQYEYYRDSLLTRETKVELKTLNQISENCDNQRKPVTSGNRVKGEYPYYGASGIVDYVDDYIFDGDYLLVSEDGANLLARSTPIAFSISGKNWVNNHAHILKFKESATRKFVEYYLNSINLEKYISGGAQPKLNQQNLNKIPIPLPALDVQQRIVNVLDNFDSICTDLKIGLPAEIEARKKQYEYYRDLLLTFASSGNTIFTEQNRTEQNRTEQNRTEQMK